MAQLQRISRNNTCVYKENGKLNNVYLYNTCIVQVLPDKIRLCTGGWLTVTTITRMNQASNEYGLGYTASRKGGILTARYHNKEYTADQDGILYLPR
jgi:hypothetical protein